MGQLNRLDSLRAFRCHCAECHTSGVHALIKPLFANAPSGALNQQGRTGEKCPGLCTSLMTSA